MMRTMMVVLAFGLLSMVFGVQVKADDLAKKIKTELAIKQTYMDCLDREPTDDDIKHYTKLLEEGTKPGEVRKGIIMSQECENAINKIFKDVQGSEASEKHMKMARKMLVEGKNLDQVKARLQKNQ